MNETEKEDDNIEYVNSTDGRTKLKNYNQIHPFLIHDKNGDVLLNEIASKSLRGIFSYVYGKPHGWISGLLFGDAYKKGFKSGFLIGFKEGGKAMETEIQAKVAGKNSVNNEQ